MMSLFAASFCCLSSPITSIPCMAAIAVVASSLCFHLLLVTIPEKVLGHKESIYAQDPPQTPTSRSIIALCIATPLLVFLMFQARRLDGSLTGVIQGKTVTSFGEKLGHGRLTPYRVLFDGHRKNINMTSLNGYVTTQKLSVPLLLPCSNETRLLQIRHRSNGS